MKTFSFAIKTALVAATLAFFSGASPAMAQTAPDVELTGSLLALSTPYGDANGHITQMSATGQTRVLASGKRRPTIYTAGDVVYESATLSFCSSNSAGQLSSCQPLDLTSNGGGTEFECTNDDDPECTCNSFLMCLLMDISGACGEEMGCDDNGCACPMDPNW